MNTTKHTPTPCTICNGVLAAAMLDQFTPEALAHQYTHTASRAQALAARVAELEAALRHMVYGMESVVSVTNYADNVESIVCVKEARAALAKASA